MTLLLTTTIVSALVAGAAGYRAGSTALENEARQRLDAQRVSKAREISEYLQRLRTAAILNSRTENAVEAVQAFTAGFEELEAASPDPGDTARVRAYYDDTFLPLLRRGGGGTGPIDDYLPSDTAATYLQARYVAPFSGPDPDENFDAAIEVLDAGDDSAWTAAHRRHHGFFRDLTLRNGYEDTVLLDTNGNVVYSAYKGADLGTNLVTGPFASPTFVDAFEEVLRSNEQDASKQTDFEPYAPSYGAPTAFDMSPIGKDGKLVGVLMVHFPVDQINEVMTNGEQWASSGFGESGETFLVGPDGTLRSTSRSLVEDPADYEAAVSEAGLTQDTVDLIVRTGDPILRQPIVGADVDRAFRGQSGSFEIPTYTGSDVLSSYQPVDTPDLNWIIIAQIDRAEAFSAQRSFLRQILIATVALILLIGAAAWWAALAFLRPVRRLKDGVKAVEGGDLTRRVDLNRSDEFGDLGDAFNDMTSSLAFKANLLVAQRAENERILLSLVPESVATRMRQGETNISAQHPDVSVVSLALSGIEEANQGLGSARSMERLNDLLAGFDRATATHGLTRVRSLRSRYIASCGVDQPVPDHALRVAAFAEEVTDLVAQFNRAHRTSVRCRIGIASGAVTTGLIGRSAGYDMWGEPVDVATMTPTGVDTDGTYVTETVLAGLVDHYEAEPAAPIQGRRGAEVLMWRITRQDAPADGDVRA